MDNSDLILVVDDTPANLAVLSEALSDADFEVAIATDGELAITQAELSLPSLILLDVMMPGIDGFETCRRLKASKITQNIPIIFMTALSDSTDKVKG
ncbi:MAG: response regulator, partial [Okeania sp. SIO2F4]|uniref:response regulator n=1 Tax=Okeania sp. SIO2F4 TaxID=2607790 RepID=UPI00142AB521